MPASESYPDALLDHAEHDWARIDGDEAVLGITWFAQDALGELVHYEAPETGATVTRDQSYGEVESVKAVSDVIAPLSGEVLEVNQTVVDAPETVNEDPYGEGWLIRIRLTSPDEREQLLGLEAYEAMLATIGVSSMEELFSDIPERMRYGRELDIAPALTEVELQRHMEELAGR